MTDTVRLFDIRKGRYQPDSSHTYSHDPGYTLNQRLMAVFVGLVALNLPFAMIIGAIYGTCYYDSISHFYYAQFLGGIFIAALVFIGTFLLAYRGESARENRLATMAGFTILNSHTPKSGRLRQLYSRKSLPPALQPFSLSASLMLG